LPQSLLNVFSLDVIVHILNVLVDELDLAGDLRKTGRSGNLFDWLELKLKILDLKRLL
jgi:hypothetical protein